MKIKLIVISILLTACSTINTDLLSSKLVVVTSDDANPCDSHYDYICTQETIENREKVRKEVEAAIAETVSFGLRDAVQIGNMVDKDMQSFYISCKDPYLQSKYIEELKDEVKEKLKTIKSKTALLTLLADNMLHGTRFSVVYPALVPRKNPKTPLLTIKTNLINYRLKEKTLKHGAYYQNTEPQIIKLILQSASVNSSESTVKFIQRAKEDLSEMSYYGTRQINNYYRQSPIPYAKFAKKYPNLLLMRIAKYFPENLHFIEADTSMIYSYWNELLERSSLKELRALYAFGSLSNAMRTFDEGVLELYQSEMAKLYGQNSKQYKRALIASKPNQKCWNKMRSLFSERYRYISVASLEMDLRKRRDRAKIIIESIRSQYLYEVARITWLSAKTKNKLLQKLKKLEIIAYHPDEIEDWDHTELLYMSNYDLKSNLEKAGDHKIIRTIDMISDVKKECATIPLYSGSHYSPACHRIYLGLETLLPPISQEGDTVENYASIGFIVAHEIGHALSIEKGKSIQDAITDTYSKKEERQLKKRFSIFMEQFGEKSKVTFSENLADYLGLSITLKALKKSYPKIKQKDYKLFFKRYTSFFCEATHKSTNRYAEGHYEYEVHSSGDLRVDEQFPHQSEFSETFQCKKSDTLVLDKKDLIQFFE
ncbi:MAG: hypothetical protein KAG61_01200 [Bacteriovoracaceae bacterium]|nr:hypothetical protein [Bacteriovoracaceae bacterium]